MTSRILVLTAVIWFVAAPFAVAQQESPYAADMRFVNELRKRGDAALAMDYLLRMSKSADPEFAKELPFEIARTELLIGTEEPESGKRLALYQKTRGDFEAFLKSNPDSPRAGEARLEIAHVAVLQGKTQLSKALTQDTLEGRVTEAMKARHLFEDAGKQLDAAYADLQAMAMKIPEADKVRRKKMESDLLQAEFSKALNTFDISQTFLNTGSDEELRDRGKVLDNATAALQALVDKDNGSIGWQAIAWLARCQQLLGSPPEARKSLTRLLNIKPTPASADAHRLGQYFLMLLDKENPEPTNKNPTATAIFAARAWLKEYSRQRNTPEGYGVRYFLAQNLIDQAENAPKSTPEATKNAAIQEARTLLKDVEHSENDFTDRARRLMIAVIERQGGFKVPLEQLKTFEDCSVRSQYEIYMISKDLEGVTDVKEREAKVKARREAAMKALELGLTKPDAQPKMGVYSYEVNNARLALAYHYLTNGKNREAIKAAEALARQDIRASQAPTAAAYAMQGYAQYLAEREQKVATPDELKPDRDKLLAFAKFAEEAWPDDLPANLGRHQIGMMLLREKKLGEAIAKLNTVTLSYPSYALVKYQIADACFAAEKAKVEPLKDQGSYGEIAMKALMSIPDSVLGSGDATINHVYFLSKVRIGQELFKAKKFAEMEKLAAPLLGKVKTFALDLDTARNAKLQEEITTSLDDIHLYGKFGLADVDFKEKRYAKAFEMLGPIVAEINEGKHLQLKSNPQFTTSLLNMALKATVQVNSLDQTKAVLAAMQKVGGDGDGGINMLLQLVDLIQNQIDDLTKKGDKAELAKTKTAFEQILNGLKKAQIVKSMEFIYLLAKNYSALEMHEKAADILERVDPPAKTNMKEADEKNERIYHTVRAAFIRELRLSGDKKRAADMLKEIMVIDGKPGWGAGNIDAQLEQVLLLEEDGKFGAAAKLADQWVNKLKGKADADVQIREKYLEFYYHTAYCFYKFGVAQKEKGEKAKGDKTIKEAATQLVQLEKTWKGFGSDASTKRILELFEKEPALKAVFDAVKK